MHSVEPPGAPQGRGLWWILLAAGLLVAAGGWYLSNRPAEPAAGPPARTSAGDVPAAGPPADARSPEAPSSANDRPDSTERPAGRSPSAGAATGRARRGADADRAATSPKPGTSAARELRVSSDVDGAYVFLDRKFLGTTPFASRDVTPGTHQLNVQAEGRPPVVRTIEIAEAGPTEVAVTLAPAPAAALAQFSAEVAVVHQHAVGSCEGILRATGDGFRYETTHKDAFVLPAANVGAFTVDYAAKRLRLQQRGGRTWNFTTRAANADPLFVFHRDVQAARTP